MEMSDDYQDMVNPGGGVAMGNIQPMGHHRHTPESPLIPSQVGLSKVSTQLALAPIVAPSCRFGEKVGERATIRRDL
uniref:Uncharacterized protein n=1 Tax=Vespula pensylvanica TaxID=30213 RepID=A0A834MZV8_VESPE|nr:hypothetical protein H0235_017812 [Vespula pensylvanica]